MERVRVTNSTDVNSTSDWNFDGHFGPYSALEYGGNIHGAIYGFAAVSLAITTITTCLRVYTKFHFIKVRRWDDYLMIASWAGLVCMWSFILASVKYGAGADYRDVVRSEAPHFQKYALFHDLFYAITQCLLKTSISLQLLHIFIPNPNVRALRTAKFWIIVVFIALENAWYFSFFWVSLFQCTPVKKEFNYTGVKGHCIGGWNAYNIIVSSWNMVSDILMFLFPMFCVWKVQMKLKFKVEAASVFFLGALAVASSCLRLVFTIRRFHTDDYTLVVTQIALCDTGEITAGILVGNSVSLPRLIVEITNKIKMIRHPELYRLRGTPSTATIATTATSAGTTLPGSLDYGRSLSSRNTSASASVSMTRNARLGVRSGVGLHPHHSDVSSLSMDFEEMLEAHEESERPQSTDI